MAASQQAQFDGGQDLTWTQQTFPYLGTLLRRMITSLNSVAENSAVAAVGKKAPPHPIDSVNISGAYTASTNSLAVNGEILHLTLTHNQAVDKGIKYFTEVDTSPNFPQPHVFEHGSSRSLFVNLPTKDVNNNTQTYYARSYAQYPGSDPTKPTVYGGLSGATAITMSGSSQVSLLPSTGSGTASTSGQQGGSGLGKTTTRSSPAPKRNVA